MKRLLLFGLLAYASVAYGQNINGIPYSVTSVPNASLSNSNVTLTAGCGIAVTGSPVSLGGSATVGETTAVNPQTGTSYTFLSTDCGKLVTFSNASAVAASLPQATGSFTTGFTFYVQNLGAGTLTITPTTSTINGSATITASTGQGFMVVSDGTNWQVMLGKSSGGGSGTVTSVGLTITPSWLTVSGSPITTSGSITVAATTGQTSHEVIGTCGSATSFGPCALTAADLPVTLVGVHNTTFSATPNFDLSLGTVQTITLTANITSFTVSNPFAGACYTFVFIQNGTGGFTVSSPPGTFKGFFSSLITTASTRSTQTLCYDGTDYDANGPGTTGQ